MVGAPARRAAALLAAALQACGPDPALYPFLRTERGGADADAGPADGGGADAGIPDEPLEDWDTSGAGPLTGIFATEVVVKATVAIPVESRQLLRLRILQHGRQIRQRISLCRFLLPSVPRMAELEVPPAAEAILRSRGGEREGPYLSAEEAVGAEYRPEPEAIVLGAALDDPLADPLPTPEDPARALDEDEDGQPGVTLEATTVVCEEVEELYVAMRVVVDLAGTVRDLDTISGEVEPTLDQSVLGYSHDCLAVAAQLPIEIVPGSTFAAQRTEEAEDLDGNGNVSCGEIVRSAPARFGEHWAPEEG